MDKSTIPPGGAGSGGSPRFPPLRPDGTAVRSWRAKAAMPPGWRQYLFPVHGPAVARRREELGLGGQRALASLLSSREFEVRQPEVSDLEHGGTYVNEVYLVRLAAVLDVAPEALLAPAQERVS